jgi:hypothetical protein
MKGLVNKASWQQETKHTLGAMPIVNRTLLARTTYQLLLDWEFIVNTRFSFCCSMFVAVIATSHHSGAKAADARVNFMRDIRPLLSDRCFHCHGPAEKSREEGLRFDTKDGAMAALESDGYAIVPGKPDESVLLERIASHDKDERMPPDDSGKPALTKQQIELFRKWIAQGAEWQEHWSFVVPSRPKQPKVTTPKWGNNEIDPFILERLESEGLKPSGEAAKHILIRRATFDLIGLPPTPEEVAAFLKDTSPNAYEKVIDRLLASKHYGEHMARFWLDAARYGDTHGLHLDNYREMWPYRDWVIRAFNANKPFDVFATEQLAGDLLPNASLEQKIASGFNRCHVTTNEGGSIKEEVYVRNVIDRVTTTATIFMGLSFECTRCHNHKYDPLTMKDFYGTFAFFNSLDANSMDGNKKNHAPVVKVASPETQEQLKKLDTQLATAKEKLEDRRSLAEAAFVAWLGRQEQKKDAPPEQPEGLIAHYTLDDPTSAPIKSIVGELKPGKAVQGPVLGEGKFGGAYSFNGTSYCNLGDVANFDRTDKFSYGAWVKIVTPKPAGGAILARMNDGNGFRGWDLYLQGGRVAAHLIHKWKSDALKVATKKALTTGKWHHVFVTYDGTGKPGGMKIYIDGKQEPTIIEANTLKSTTKSKTDLRIGRRSPGSAFTGGMVDDVRIYGRKLAASEVSILAGDNPIGTILVVDPSKRTPEQIEVLRKHYLATRDNKSIALREQIAKLEAHKSALAKKTATTTLVYKELVKPRQAYILDRGEYDKKGEKVGRNTPAILPPMSADLPRNRLGYAKWLLSPEHPLTARVTINRLWQQCFGTGIVKTSEDFGSQGEVPSHPELLDWLAVEFRDSGWNMKHMMKKMVMSAAYRQNSKSNAQLTKLDPENRLLARGPRYRLDAEMLRDQALSVSGLLVPKFFGPGVKPPQPDGLWFSVGYSGSNTVRFKKDTGPEKVYRRSLYTFWKRTSPPPQMGILDAPSRESCAVRRERTNTPLQALMLLNDPQYVEAARVFAERTMKESGGDDKAAAKSMFLRTTARTPSPEELAELLKSHQMHADHYTKNPAAAKQLIAIGESKADAKLDPVKLAAWTMTANLILNLDEVLTKN